MNCSPLPYFQRTRPIAYLFTLVGTKMAELAGLPNPTMDWHSPDAPQAFKKFKARCELYFSGPLKEKSEEEQISYLFIWSGDDGIELVSTWALSNEEKKKLDIYWTRFESFLSPKSNFRLSRYKLRTLKQQPGESVDSFVKKIRILVEECRFTKLIFSSIDWRTVISSSQLSHFDNGRASTGVWNLHQQDH